MIVCSKPYECKHYPTGVVCAICENGERFCPRTMTRADRLRSMTDEELAEFMCHNVSNGTVNCTFCAVAEFCRMGHNGWLEWLKQEEQS